ncbi:hypothetical protein N9L68_08190 [bacterium]|nr:hypothetical protein [bacterium]
MSGPFVSSKAPLRCLLPTPLLTKPAMSSSTDVFLITPIETPSGIAYPPGGYEMDKKPVDLHSVIIQNQQSHRSAVTTVAVAKAARLWGCTDRFWMPSIWSLLPVDQLARCYYLVKVDHYAQMSDLPPAVQHPFGACSLCSKWLQCDVGTDQASIQRLINDPYMGAPRITFAMYPSGAQGIGDCRAETTSRGIRSGCFAR